MSRVRSEERIRRGTIQVNIRVNQAKSVDDYRINVQVLAGYRRQIESLNHEWKMDGPVPLESLLLLPGVVDESSVMTVRVEDDWPLVRADAPVGHRSYGSDAPGRRPRDGCRSGSELRRRSYVPGRDSAAHSLGRPRLSPRLEERLRKTLAEFNITLDPADLIREVSLFGERCDISEEIVRLRSHLDQFAGLIQSPESCGRKLEFLAQEMSREVNTIGSKANDVEISRQVIESKAAIERIREMIQNVE